MNNTDNQRIMKTHVKMCGHAKKVLLGEIITLNMFSRKF